MSYPPVIVIDGSTDDPVKVLRETLGFENPNPHQIVELSVDLDLTGETGIIIGDNRSLIASASRKRSARALGPRVYVRDERDGHPLFLIRGDNVLVAGFRLEGPTSDIGMGDRKEQGIRVSPPATDGEGKLLPAIKNIEICNMEIFHWSGVGIYVADNALARDHRELKGRLFKTNPAAVRIKRCYVHHNRHGDGYGYGVESTAGAYVTIEQNVFDENRHAVAGGSKARDVEDYSGYTARDNLILAGGGVHCADRAGTGALIGLGAGALIGGLIGGLVGGLPGALVGAAIGGAVGAGLGAMGGSVCWQTHQIDMHGTKDSRLHGGEHCCGTAGETITIERNTILYTGGTRRWLGARRLVLSKKGKAIKIRGNPLDKAVVDGNVFRHKTRGAAIAQNGEPGEEPTNPIIVLDPDTNKFNCGDTTAELDHGDFAVDIDCGDITTDPRHGHFADDTRADITPEFGDGESAGEPGQQDDFMATGVTWWARSRRTHQWRYLNTMKERLPELQLGKFDDDDIYDVAPRTPHPEVTPPEKYSKSGTSPWISRNVIHP
jgi:hypothetical protein